MNGVKKLIETARVLANSPRLRPSNRLLQQSVLAPLCAQLQPNHLYHSSATAKDSSHKIAPPRKRQAGKHTFIPQKAAVNLTDTARTFFKQLLANPPRPDIIGIMLKYDQSKQGDMRMVFSFNFCTADDVSNQDEPVSLEVLETQVQDGVSAATPKPYVDSINDGLPKLYVNANAFLKVLGATVDVDVKELKPVLRDRDGNLMDPNA